MMNTFKIKKNKIFDLKSKFLFFFSSQVFKKKGELAKNIGVVLATIHAVDIIHEDLTTSNLMLFL